MATLSSTLAWKIPWTEEPGGLQSMGLLSQAWLHFHFHFSFSHIGEGNGNPLQCSWPAESQGQGAWWAAIYGVAQSRTRLKRLSSSNSSGPLEMCCLISTYFWSSQICFCYCFLILLLCGQTANLFLSLKGCWGLLCGLARSPIWQKFHLHLGRV